MRMTTSRLYMLLTTIFMSEMLLAKYLDIPFLVGINGIAALITTVIATWEDINERTGYRKGD